MNLIKYITHPPFSFLFCEYPVCSIHSGNCEMNLIIAEILVMKSEDNAWQDTECEYVFTVVDFLSNEEKS